VALAPLRTTTVACHRVSGIRGQVDGSSAVPYQATFTRSWRDDQNSV